MTIELRVPDVGESIQEVQIAHWLKKEGDHVGEDENVVELETDKASMELPSPAAGILKIVKHEGEAAAIGETIAYVDEGKAEVAPPARAATSNGNQPPTEKPNAQSNVAASSDRKGSESEATRPDPKSSEAAQRPDPENASRPAVPATPSARRALREYGLSAEEVEAAGKQLRREDVLRHVEHNKSSGDGHKTDPASTAPAEKASRIGEPTQPIENRGLVSADASEEVVPMSMIRRRIAERLVEAQHNAALLTTYNEIDMSAVLGLRKEFGEKFRERHGVKLGFMSFFVKAVVDALQEVPELNAEIRGTDIVYKRRYDIGIAIGSDRGLVVPVLRNADRLSFAEIERAIADFAERANSKKLLPRDLTGGTFTVSNGGIYGSLLSTPIVNPPQSGVLGMHAIQERPVARDGQVVIRPMMYVALSYDHRIIDGRQAVSWLRRVKESIEQPARILIEA